ncbi:MAG: hypothetical protein AB2L11_11000 [Syntrophobacteraceae bacterium]
MGRQQLGKFYGVEPEIVGLNHLKRQAALLFRSTWSNIIRLTREAGHGGCFMIVPNVGWEDKGLRIKYQYNKDEEVDILYKLSCWLNEILGKNAYQEKLSHNSFKEYEKTIGLVSQLSKVDGAVVISRNLEILGFGAILELEENSGSQDAVYECAGCDYEPCKKKSLSLFGTRHRSAASFCKRCSGSTAYVISQDGDLRIMYSITDRIYLWDGFLDSLIED